MTSTELRQAVADAEGNPEALKRLVFQEHRAAREAAVLLEESRAALKSAEEQKVQAERLQAAQAIAESEQDHAQRKLHKADEVRLTQKTQMNRELGVLCGGVWMLREILKLGYGKLAERLTRQGITNQAEFESFFRDIANPANFGKDELSVAFANKIQQIMERKQKLA